MRTADAIGAHGIIIPKRRSVSLTAVVAKASTGAIEHVPVVRVNNLAQTIDELKERGIWIAGTDAKGSADYRKMDATLPLAIIIGSEGKGMGRLLKKNAIFISLTDGWSCHITERISSSSFINVRSVS